MNTPCLAWTVPNFELLRMDAEIGSYQEDSEGGRDEPAFVGESDEAESA